MPDPFSLVFTGLWDMALDSPGLTDLVRVGNCIRFDSDTRRDPEKDTIQDTDLPELILSSEGIGSLNLHESSSGSRVVHNYAWMISTGDMRINLRHNPVRWALLCAMLKWTTALTALEWEGALFVKRVDVMSVTDGVADAAQNRNIKGWSSIIRVEVQMHFRTLSMLEYANGGS